MAALGATDELVGRSAECDYPPQIEGVPILMRARTLDAQARSAEIDERVREARARGESLYVIDTAALAAAAPDVLLTQDLCGVCSVTSDEVAEARRAAGTDPQIVSLTPSTLESVWETVLTIGDAIGRSGAARQLVERLRSRSRSRSVARRPVVAVVEWLDPPILSGLWTPEIVARAGGVATGPSPGGPGERTSWSSLAQRAPELTILSPCSFSVDRTLAELRDGACGPAIRETLAGSRVAVADEAYFSRPGPRLAEGVALVAELLGHRADGPPPAMPYVMWPSPARETGS